MEWSCAGCGAAWPEGHRFCAHCGTPRTHLSATADATDVLRALVGEQLADRVLDAGGRLPEQRRLVTALFADLSGFTPLAGRLDPEELAAVVDPLLEGLVRVVKRGEGYVGSFAGDALLAFFGAPVAHEDDAERALRCAVQMLEEFPALLAATGPTGASLSLRIGVDTGAVLARLVAGDVRTDYAVMGNAVNMAQRLQSHAPPGGCFVGGTTAALAQQSFDLVELDPLQVKGRSDPLPAWQLVGERVRSVTRRPQRTAALVGRDVEVAALREALAPGPVRGLVLHGEAGTGKSRLVEAARSWTPRSWAEGGCAAHDTSTSYRPWQAALASLGAPDLLTVAGLAPAARRQRVAHDVADLLRAIAPVTVVLEDLHWADQPSLDLLDDLLHDLGDDDVLLLATSRTPLPEAPHLQQLHIGPLGEGAVGELVRELLDGLPPEELVADLARRSGGNPLYVGELAHALDARGVVHRADGGVLVAPRSELAAALDVVPASLEGLVGARIDALPASQARVLTVAAVLGPPLRAELVAAVAGRSAVPRTTTETDLAALQAHGLLVGDGFSHAVLQDTAYSRTPRARRRELHLAAADAVTEAPDLVAPVERSGFLARHLYLGGAGSRAVTALRAAADDAAARSVLEEAVLHLGREVELRRLDLSDRAEMPDRLTVLGEHLEVLGRYADALPVLAEAHALGADLRAERARVGCLRRTGDYDGAIAAADEVLATEQGDPALRARLSEERGWAYAATGRLYEATSRLEPAADEEGAAHQQLLLAYCLIQTGRAEEATALLEDCQAVLQASDDLAARARALRMLGYAHARSGDRVRAVEVLQRGLRSAREDGIAEEVSACLNTLVMAHGTSGDFSAALACSREAVEHADRLRHAFGRSSTRNNHAYTLVLAGSAEEAVEVAVESARLAREAGLPTAEGAALHTLASAQLGLGRPDQAAQTAERSAHLLAGSDQEADSWDLANRAWESAGDPVARDRAARRRDALSNVPSGT